MEVYSPLSIERREIRLIQLRAARTPHDQILCDLRTVSLNDYPKYEALSYAWGDVPSARQIKINGCLQDISENLSDALQELRDKPGKPLLWIDQLCINQKDDIERGQQVRTMGDIYRAAVMVIVWLGKADLNTVRIIDMPIMLGFPRRPQLIKYNYSDEDIDNLERFFDRGWWRRLWVLQEVILAQRVVLQCGKTRIHFRSLLTAYHRLSKISEGAQDMGPDPKKPQFDHEAAQNIRVGEILHKKLAIFEQLTRSQAGIANQSRDLYGNKSNPEDSHQMMTGILMITRSYLTSQPHDKIFGLLGLLPDEMAVEISPDYTEPVETLCLRTTRMLLANTNSLLVLNLSQGIDGSMPGPSWMVEWTKPNTFLEEGPRVLRMQQQDFFNASKGIGPWAQLVEPMVLQFRGLHVDEIHVLGAGMDCFGASSTEPLKRLLQTLNTWSALLPSAGEDIRLESSRTSLETQEKLTNPTATLLRRAFAATIITETTPSFTSPDVKLATDFRLHVHLPDVDVTLEEFILSLTGALPDPQLSEHPSLQSTIEHIRRTTSGRKFFLTKQGMMGLCPHGALPGDKIFILGGGTFPFALRPHGQDENHFSLVGEVYVRGLMHGLEAGREFFSGNLNYTTESRPWDELETASRPLIQTLNGGLRDIYLH